MLFEALIRFKRQALILASIKDGQSTYILRDEDLLSLKRMVVGHQIPLWTYRKAREGDIGGFVPLAVMQDIKKVEVEQSN